MPFVDLHRSFVPLDKDEEAALDFDPRWGRKYGGWLDWPDLLKRRRVVLLAEAASGKTEELRHQAKSLESQGQAAFFVTIEDLADDVFENALEPRVVDLFRRWRDGMATADAWFFLDSVDEARLNRKELRKALKCFRRAVNGQMERIRVYLSCRASDWRGQADRAAIEELLPVPVRPIATEQDDPDAALLDPVFKESRRTGPPRGADEQVPDAEALLVVRLVPLAAAQRRQLAAANEVQQPDAFVTAVEQQGLDALAERPGDLLDLVAYWRDHHGQFGSLAEMTEHGVARKLAEEDKYRPDNQHLAAAKARQGAERLAAALTLARSFTIRAPGHEPDPTLAAGAVDPAAVLDWTDAERNALLRRGIFAPATYDRIRFHHRGTQEYLTAQWLHRLLQAGCPRQAVWDLLFVERYGVETVVPSLRPAAAWLALKNQAIRDEIIRREPLVLLRHGDPGSLPLAVKEQLLLAYATRHAAGEIADDMVDHRSLWMFATPDLADAIRQAWSINDRTTFRTDLLRLVREGTIHACVDLARPIVVDPAADDYLRIVALEAIEACADEAGLVAAAAWLNGATPQAIARLGPHFAKLLFPRRLSVDELLGVIERFPGQEDHLSYPELELKEFWQACPDVATRDALLAGLGTLCLKPPFRNEIRRVSARYHWLASRLTPLAHQAVLALGEADISAGLIQVLMAIERSDQYGSWEEDAPHLAAMVAANGRLKRRLFWADVEETRRNGSRRSDLAISWNQARPHPTPLWQLGAQDLGWLCADLADLPRETDRRTALRTIVSLLRRQHDGLDAEVDRLRSLVKGSSALQEALESFLTPTVNEPEEPAEWKELTREIELAKDQETCAKKASWIAFRDQVSANPAALRDPAILKDWAVGASKLLTLNRWLANKAGHGLTQAARHWRLLAKGFGEPVAEAFREGMKLLWRITTPARPVRKNGMVEGQWTIVLSIAGLGIEAAEDRDWAARLLPCDAKRAAEHACLAGAGYPAWLDDLIDQHPSVVLPLLRKTLQAEWSNPEEGCHDFLVQYSGRERQIQPAVQEILFAIITGPNKPASLTRLHHGLAVLGRLDLDPEDRRRRAAALARRRLRAAHAANNDAVMHRYLAMLFLVNGVAATDELVRRLDISSPGDKTRFEAALAALFSHIGLAQSALADLPVPSLLALTHQAYRPAPSQDEQAKEARGALLQALIRRPGAEAFHALHELADEEAIGERAASLRELAHGKAESDAELPAWTPAEVLNFEHRHVVPAKTGEALLQVVLGVLAEIQQDLRHEDFTSRPLLTRAADEPEVQGWLAEQLSLRSRGQFHVHREAKVADMKQPDIVVSSTAARFEVAIEVKHGGMDWTVRELERALTRQLAEDYLKPASRRHGILVVSHHGKRTWRDPATRASLQFPALVSRLDELARRLPRNALGAIAVRVKGLDASTPV
ncbi:MAG: hypothetical protein AB1634_15820 [Thermodesulfobacteriota bacterium]